MANCDIMSQFKLSKSRYDRGNFAIDRYYHE